MNWNLRYANEKTDFEKHFKESKDHSDSYVDYLLDSGRAEGIPSRPSTWAPITCKDHAMGLGCKFHNNPDYSEWEHQQINKVKDEAGDDPVLNVKAMMLKGMHRATCWKSTPRALEIQNGDPKDPNYLYGAEVIPQKSEIQQGVSPNKAPMSTCMDCTLGNAW